MKLLSNKSNSSGQALLLVLLAMSVVLTVALSIVSRSITDISNSAREEDSTRAFSAAESGIERALIVGNTGSQNLGDATFNATITAGTASTSFVHPVAVASGDALTFWFLNHDAAGVPTCTGNSCFTGNNLRVCWGNTGSADIPAAEVSILYTTTPGSYAQTREVKVSYDPSAIRRASNNFAAPDAGTCTIGTKSFPYQKNIDLTTAFGAPAPIPNPILQGTLLFSRVKLLYNTTAQEVGVSSTANLPPQANTIDSLGAAGGANRKLQVSQIFGDVPPIFGNLIYSGTAVTK